MEERKMHKRMQEMMMTIMIQMKPINQLKRERQQLRKRSPRKSKRLSKRQQRKRKVLRRERREAREEDLRKLLLLNLLVKKLGRLYLTGLILQRLKLPSRKKKRKFKLMK